MSRFCIILAVIAITLQAINAEPPRFRTSRRNGALRTNIRFLARQEEDPAVATTDGVAPPAPYPPAGVTPEIPFDLPTETEAPAAQPDLAYGPPEAPDNTYGPPPTVAAAEPDNAYGPPNTDEQPATDEPAAEELPADGSDLVSQNLMQPRNKFALRSRARSAPLLVRTAPRAGVVEIVRAEPIIVYTLK